MQVHSNKRGRRRAGAVVLGAALVAVGISSHASAQTVVTWVNPVDGFWVDSVNWSTGSFYPNNGSPTPGDHYAVTIGASGAPHTVTLNTSVSIDRVSISSPDVTLRLQGGELTTPSINLSGGQLLIASGNINGSTIAVSGTGKALANASGALNTVTLQGALQLAPTNAAQLVIHGLTLANGTVSIARTDNAFSAATLSFQGTQTIAGQGAIVLEGPTDDHLRVDSGTLTLGPTTVIRSGSQSGLGSIDINNIGGYLINQGLISAQTAGSTIQIVATNFGTGLTNLGTLEAINGGALSMNCLTGSVGNIHLASGGFLGLSGSFTIDHPITIGSGNSLGLGAGSWVNSSVVDATGGSLQLASPPTSLGTVILNDATLVVGSFTSAQVSALPLASSSVVRVLGNLNNSGTTILMDGPKGSWRLGGGTISGGSISSIGSGTYEIVGPGSSGTLSSATINTNLSINQGTLNLRGGTNNGRIISNDSLLRLLLAGPLGSIQMSGGTLAISRSITTADLLSVDRSNTQLVLESGTIANSASNLVLDTADGGFLMQAGTIFGGTVSSPNGATLTMTAGTLSGVLLQTTLLAHGGVSSFIRFAGGSDNQATIKVISGTMVASTAANISVGSLNGGTWSVSGGATLDFGSSTITTNNAAISLDGLGSTFTAINPLQTNLGRFTITNGRNFNTVGSLTNSGSITVGPQSTLTVLTALNNATGFIDMNNKLIVDYSGASPLDELVSQIGTHIISSLAVSDPNLAIGSMDNGDVVLLQLTDNGDTNLDGLVNYTDLNTLSQHYSDSIVPLHWVDGDFNYDGSVNLTDLYALGYNYQDPQHPLEESLEQLGLPPINVPEPAVALGLFGLVSGIRMARRRRRCESR